MASPQDFYTFAVGNKYNHGNGWNDSAYGYQCVAGFKEFCEWANIPVKPTPNNYASGYWLYRQQLGYAQYFEFIEDWHNYQTGDWVIWAKASKSHPSSHIAMWYDGLEFGQNQGYPYFTLKATDFTDSLGALRWKGWNGTDSNIKMHGCDLSEWQIPSEDLIKDKDFVIIRATYGRTKDKYANEWRLLCEKLDIPYGVYCYSYAESETEAYNEADFICKTIDGWNIQMGVWYDMEIDDFKRNHGITTSEQWTNFCNTFCKRVQEYGYYTGIYASESYFQSHIHTTDWDRWVASWGTNDGTIQRDTSSMGTMLQYTSNGGLDQDITYCDLAHYKSYPINSSQDEQVPIEEDKTHVTSGNEPIQALPSNDDNYLFKMSNKTYDFLNWLVHITPLFITLYIALSNIWKWEYTEPIVATISAIVVFISSIVKQSTIGYKSGGNE